MEFDAQLRAAAVDLQRELAGQTWLSSVGIAEDDGRAVFVLYAGRRVPARLRAGVPHTWRNTPVRLVELGRVIPAVAGHDA